MPLTLKYPTDQRSAERPRSVAQTTFRGMIKDAPSSELPPGYSALLDNLYGHGEYEEGRPGTSLYSDVDEPGGEAVQYGAAWHEKASRIVYQRGALMYHSDVAISVYDVVHLLGGTPYPNASTSLIVPFGKHAYLFNASGIYRIVMDDLAYYYYRINAPLPATLITGVAETASKVYGHKYTYAFARLRGDDLRTNRQASGMLVEWESGTCDDASGKDYGLVFYDEIINPSQLAAHSVGVLTQSATSRHATHFPLYRTKNVGQNSDPPGIDPITGLGNNAEKFVWVDDVPLTKCWYGAYDHATQTLTPTSGVGHIGDIGNMLKDENGMEIDEITVATSAAIICGAVPNAIYGGLGYTGAFTVYDTGSNLCDWDIGCFPILASGRKCRFTTTGTLPAIAGGGTLVAGTDYYIIGTGATHASKAEVKIATSYANALAGIAIDFANNGAGTHTMYTNFAQAFGIGNGQLCVASQAATTITIVSGDVSSIDQHRPLFWSDGDWSMATAVVGVTSATAAWSDNHAVQALMLPPVSGNFTRTYNDTIPDTGTGYGVEGLHERAATGRRMYFPSRFFDPLPNSNIGAIGNGFMVVATRDATPYYYSQYQNKRYAMGYYRPGDQEGEATSPIRHLVLVNKQVVMLQVKQTYGLRLNFSTNVGNAEYGEDVFKLNDADVISEDIGVYHWETLRKVRGPSLFLALTDEDAPKVRYFLGDRWDEKDLCMEGDLAAVVNDVAWISNRSVVTASYVPGPFGGYKVWGIDSNVSWRCLRYAVDASEGYGWSQITGPNWVLPIANNGILTVRDANRVSRCIVRDRVDRFVYEDGTYNTYTLTKPTYLDKGATEILTVGWSQEITASPNENSRLEVENSYDSIRPQTPDNRGAAGYGASGLRAAQEFALEEYIDGEKTTPNAVAHDVPEQGDITYASSAETARRLQYVRKSKTSEFRRVSIRHEIMVKPDQGSRTERTMSEWEWEGRLCSGDTLKWHLARNPVVGYERCGRTTLDMGDITRMTGPDGRSLSAMQTPANTTGAAKNYALVHPAIAGTYSILLWRQTGVVLTSGGAPVALTTHKTSGTWNLCYLASADLAANALALQVGIGAAALGLYSMRLIHASVVDSDMLDDYYRDVVQHEGRKYEPRF